MKKAFVAIVILLASGSAMAAENKIPEDSATGYSKNPKVNQEQGNGDRTNNPAASIGPQSDQTSSTSGTKSDVPDGHNFRACEAAKRSDCRYIYCGNNPKYPDACD